MYPDLSLIIFCTVALAFGISGAVLARNRGRSIILWGVVCTIFPVFLLVIWYEKPTREVKGGFRRCRSCGEYYRWQRKECTYCGTPAA